MSKNRVTRHNTVKVILPMNLKRDKDDVMLDTQVFRHARCVLKFKPGVDLFASDHQLPRHYALEADPLRSMAGCIHGKLAFRTSAIHQPSLVSQTQMSYVDINAEVIHRG